jgi:hypothetical protein
MNALLVEREDYTHPHRSNLASMALVLLWNPACGGKLRGLNMSGGACHRAEPAIMSQNDVFSDKSRFGGVALPHVAGSGWSVCVCDAGVRHIILTLLMSSIRRPVT